MDTVAEGTGCGHANGCLTSFPAEAECCWAVEKLGGMNAKNCKRAARFFDDSVIET